MDASSPLNSDARQRIGQERRDPCADLFRRCPAASSQTGDAPFLGPALTEATPSTPAHQICLLQSRRPDALRSLSPVARLLWHSSATVARRHGHRPNLWGFHVCLPIRPHSPCGRHSSAPALPLSADSPAFVDHMAALLASTLDGDSQTRLTALEAALKAFHNRAAVREHALARSIESERARLSASLLQRGLFDRRAERALSAQTAVLDEALARCRARLGED